MARTILAVLAGYATWSALWLGGNAAFFSSIAEAVEGGDPYTDAGGLAPVLLLSFACSVLAGVVAALIAKAAAPRAVTIMAWLLFATGVAVQSANWALLPIWYHLVFLALIVPLCMVGGRLGASRA